MISTNFLLNTCYIGPELTSLAYYSHLVPVFFALSLALLVFFKAKHNIFSKTFLAFISIFSLWLIGDLITWVSTNYYLIYTTWSLLVYTEIAFFVLGLYFSLIFVRKSDISLISKVLLFASTLIPFFLTITQQSVTGFNYPVCEAFNNALLDEYKLYLEMLIIGLVFVTMIIPFFNKAIAYTKKTHAAVLGSMFLFLAVFSVTEYLSAATGNYEINLYALFVIPIFLIAITYSIFSLDIFNLRVVSTYFLVFGFLILTGSQLLFVADPTDKLLTILTIILSAGLSFLLFKNLHKESEQREHIEGLNISLRDLIKQRESLVHLVTHKVKGSFTRTKFLFAGMLDGTFGPITPEIKKRAEQGLEFDNGGIETVDLVLNVANMQNGLIKYEMKIINFKDIVLQTIEDKKLGIEAKGLKLETNIGDGVYTMTGDAFWLKEVINNLIENSIKYTKEGTITVELEDGNGKIKLSVKDTGLGINEDDKKNLFTEGGRGKDSVKVNVDSTGYGLYTVKLIVDAHKGAVSAESEGAGKGSQFYVELPAA
jgi:signal transduction histidine kinase